MSRICDYCGEEIAPNNRTAVANLPLLDVNAPVEYVTQLDLHEECAPEFTGKVRAIKGKRGKPTT